MEIGYFIGTTYTLYITPISITYTVKNKFTVLKKKC